MPHPQNTPFGLLSKQYLTASTQLTVGTQTLTDDATDLVVSGGVKVSGSTNGRTIRGNTTGYLFTVEAAKPSTRTAGYNWTFVTNSTGVSGVAVRTTGTTWKYLNVTSLLPT